MTIEVRSERMSDIDKLLSVGAGMANTLFNLEHGAELTDDVRQSLTDQRKTWDDARRQYHASANPSPASNVGSIVPPHCTGYSFVLDHGVMHVRKDGSGYIVVDENDFVLEDDRGEGPDGPEGSIHWIARMDSSEISALRDFLNGATQERVRGVLTNVMAAAAKAWASVDLATASRDELINCIASAIMEDRNHRSLRDAAITFRCPEGFEALSAALDMSLTEKDRSRLDGALKAIIQGGMDL